MVKIRLKRMGSKFNAFYRIVAADARAPRDGRFIEEIGYYNPHSKELKIKKDIAFKWLSNGAQLTDTAKDLFTKEKLLEEYNRNKPKKGSTSSKSKPKKVASAPKKVEKKPETKKEKPNVIPVGKKHEVVTMKEFHDYDYDRRRKEWHQKAGHNEVQQVCSICKDDDNWASILLDNDKHVCYYCWIKKPETLEKITGETTVEAAAEAKE